LLDLKQKVNSSREAPEYSGAFPSEVAKNLVLVKYRTSERNEKDPSF
jgi:hypothetical protein